MGPQSCGSPIYGNFRTPRTKWHLGVGPMTRHRVYYNGEGGGFPQIWAMVSLVSSCCPWPIRAPKSCNYTLTNLLFGLYRFVWVIEVLFNLPNPISELEHAPLPPKCFEPRNTPQFRLLPLFTFGLTIECIKELGGASLLKSLGPWSYNKWKHIMVTPFAMSHYITFRGCACLNVSHFKILKEFHKNIFAYYVRI
jgi:hypothetical protein